MFFTLLILTILMLPGTQAKAYNQTLGRNWQFDYANKGYDFDQAIPPLGWKGVNRCGEPENQSPINLLQPIGIYGWLYGRPIPAEFENLETNFLDPVPGSTIVYFNKNYEMMLTELDPKYGPSDATFVRTDMVKNLYQSSQRVFIPDSFHIHHPSEFPVDGRRTDFSIHLVSFRDRAQMAPGETFVVHVFAIQFSVDDYDKDVTHEQVMQISSFFDTLSFKNEGSLLQFDQHVPFKQFMEAFDLSDKWMLDGSGALPPCSKRVAWQIVRKVYPIELKHYLQIRQEILENQDELKSTSNIRGIFPLNGHDVYYIGAGRLAPVVSTLGLAVVTLLSA